MKKLLLFVFALPLLGQVQSSNGTIGTIIPGSAAAGTGCGSSCVTTIADEGTNLTQRATLNFIGSSVSCVDNPGQLRIDCTFTAGGGGGITGPVSSTVNNIVLWNATDGTAVKNSTIVTDGAGNVTTTSLSTGDGTVAGQDKMFELSANGTNFRSWLVPDTLTADLTFKFVDGVPAAGGIMGWTAPASNISTQSWYAVSGTGNVALTTSPTFVTPLLGTPTSGVLTNTTGLPIDAGTVGTLPVNRGGTGTTTPGIVAGTNVTVTGTWPNQTVNSTGGGGGSSLGVAWGYDGGTTVTTSPTTLCTISVPANTLGTGGTSGHALLMRFSYVNNTGSGAINLNLNYGSSSHLIASGTATGTTTSVNGEYILANDLGVTNAQTLAFVSQSATAGGTPTTIQLDQSTYEPNQNSASGTLDFSLKATATTTNQVIRVFMCSIILQ